jgi:hypothetical protein
MSLPSGDYGFAGLGFTGLRLFQDGDRYVGCLYYGEGRDIAIIGATYTDVTGGVTFNATESPAGLADLTFTGSIILNLRGDVGAIAGAWTGRAFNHASADPRAALEVRRTDPIIPILQAHGAWTAFNRENINPE